MTDYTFDERRLPRAHLSRIRWAVHRYVDDSTAAHQDTVHPNFGWFETWMVAVRARYSRETFKRLIYSLERYFRAHKAANPVHDPRLCARHPEWRLRPRIDFDRSGLGTAKAGFACGVIRRYVRDAIVAEQDPNAPDPQWLSDWAYGLLKYYSLTNARVALRYLPRYFSFRGLPNPFVHPLVVERLCEPSIRTTDPLQGFLQPDNRYTSVWTQAKFYADSTLCRSTREIYKCQAERFEVYAHEHGFDAASASVTQLAEYLAYVADAYGAVHVKTTRDALSHYFRQCGSTLHRDARITRIVKGILASAEPVDPPLGIDVLRKLLQYFPRSEPLDVRNRALILTIYFGGVSAIEQGALLVDGLVIDDPGVTIKSTDPHRPIICVPAFDEEGLDIRVWMRRYVQLIGDTSGPLFRRLSKRGAWIPLAPSKDVLRPSLRAAAEAAGIDGQRLLPRLRQGAIRAAARRLGPTVVAQHFGLRSTGSTPFKAVHRPAISQGRRWNFARRRAARHRAP